MSETVKVNAVGWRDWVAALRSGTYKQGTGYLRSKDGFCCWGVACDLVDPNGWDGPEDFSKGPLGYRDNIQSRTNKDGTYLMNFPPKHVKKALGVEKLGEIRYASMNDSGSTFLEIANEIEKEMADGSK